MCVLLLLYFQTDWLTNKIWMWSALTAWCGKQHTHTTGWRMQLLGTAFKNELKIIKSIDMQQNPFCCGNIKYCYLILIYWLHQPNAVSWNSPICPSFPATFHQPSSTVLWWRFLGTLPWFWICSRSATGSMQTAASLVYQGQPLSLARSGQQPHDLTRKEYIRVQGIRSML